MTPSWGGACPMNALPQRTTPVRAANFVSSAFVGHGRVCCCRHKPPTSPPSLSPENLTDQSSSHQRGTSRARRHSIRSLAEFDVVAKKWIELLGPGNTQASRAHVRGWLIHPNHKERLEVGEVERLQVFVPAFPLPTLYINSRRKLRGFLTFF